MSDVSNRADMVSKLLSYAQEELDAARIETDEVIRNRRMDRAAVFQREAKRVHDGET